MTRLRKMMLEELERRNYSEATTCCYIRTVEDFSRRFKCSPDGLGPEHIREYQAELFRRRVRCFEDSAVRSPIVLCFFRVGRLRDAPGFLESLDVEESQSC